MLGGANTYTGQTLVVAGSLEPASASALGTGPLLVKGQGRLVRRHPDAALPNGVALGASVTFEAASAVVIEWAPEYTVSGNVTVPIFSVPTNLAPDPAAIPVSHGLQNYRATVVAEDAGGGRTQFSVELAFQGTLMMVQ